MKHIQNFYVGDPDPAFDGKKLQRGQDEFGSVHCLVWVFLGGKGEFFSKPNEYPACVGGSGIGKVKSPEEGRTVLHAYAVRRLREKLESALDRARRCQQALDTLGDDPAMLERFAGDYKETRRD